MTAPDGPGEPAGRPAFDPAVIIEAVTTLLLGETPHLRREDVANLADIDLDVARGWWRALGFPETDDDSAAFTQADVEALLLTQELVDLGVIDRDEEQSFIRTLGRAYARLAEWQVRTFLGSMDRDLTDEDEAAGRLDQLETVIPIGERVQSYVWRRHLANAASRLILTESDDPEAAPTCVGFADIVGYTTRARRMSATELARLVDRFDEVTTGIITDRHGHVVKTIGDEVLFAADEPAQAARIALALLDEHLADESFPEVRIGMAHGKVLNRMGDVFGPTVNVAARLTKVARPGRAVVDRDLADALRDDDALRLKRMRRISVKGYENLEPWSLRRAREE